MGPITDIVRGVHRRDERIAESLAWNSAMGEVIDQAAATSQLLLLGSDCIDRQMIILALAEGVPIHEKA